MADEQRIKKLVEDWFTALRTNQVAKVMALYSPKAILLPTLKNKPMTTPSEIAQYFQGTFLKLNPDGILIEPTYPRLYGSVASHSGLYEFEINGPPESNPTIQIAGTVTVDSEKYEFKTEFEAKPKSAGSTPIAGLRVKAKARFSFVYQVEDGKWLIVEHHSSLLPEPIPETKRLWLESNFLG